MTTLAENGFGGHIYFQATDTEEIFGAVGDLPTGGRYLFLLENRDKSQRLFCRHFFYQQISYEILTTLSEGTPFVSYSPEQARVHGA